MISRRVLARQEGQMLDSVKDVVIDTVQRRVVALLINEGRLFSAPTVVPLEKVLSIGDDVIVVTDAASAMPVDQYPMVKEILDRDDRLVGKEVYTDAGTAFGKVVDVVFDLPHGDLAEIKVASKSNDEKPVTTVGIRVSEVVSIGPHAVVISQAAPGTAAEQPPALQPAAPAPVIDEAPPTSQLEVDPDALAGGEWSARRMTGGQTPETGSTSGQEGST